MATSGVISGTMTARQLCDAAAKDLGVYSAGETISAADGEDMMVRLTWMLKSWQADGVNLWREAEATATFAIDEKTVVLDPRCLDVLEARLVQANTFLRPLQRWELGEYRQLPNPDQSGMPSAFYLQKGASQISMTLWPVPFVETEIRYSYSRVIDDVTDLNETVDIPQEWMETVWTNLAARCVTMFGVTRLDPAAVQMVVQRAANLEQKLLDFDRPASVFMGPSYGRYDYG